jgi:hypothetical protein
MAVLQSAFGEWTEGPEGQDIHKLLRDSLAELKAVAAGAHPPPAKIAG